MFARFQRKVTIRKFILAFAFALSLGGQSLQAQISCNELYRPTIDQLIEAQAKRPDVETIERLDPETVWRYLEPTIDAPMRDPRFFKVLEASTREILENYKGEDIFFVARDGEWFYDAMVSVLRNHEGTEILSDKIHLLNLSRYVARETDGKTLMQYLVSNGLDPAQIMAGNKRVLLLDTGERGSIFINVLQKIVGTYKLDPVHWKGQIKNLLNGFEVKLLHSNMKENRASVTRTIENMKTFDLWRIQDAIENLGFGTFISSQRKAIGLPANHYDLHAWIVQTFERRKHWTGRAQKVNSKGDVITTDKSDMDRATALYSQAQILDHFSKENILRGFRSAITNALRLCGQACAKPARAAEKNSSQNPATPKPIRVKAGLELAEGQIVTTHKKINYEVIKFVDEGKRGRVYQVKSLEDGKLYALKIALDKSHDTLKSFSEEAEKNKGYELAGVSHAKVIELGTEIMIKEFVEGVRADAWLASWVKAGKPSGTAQVKELRKLLKRAAKNGVYIGDLNPKNLIWNGKTWVIVDSGSWRNDLTEQEILERYDDKVVGRWTRRQSSGTQNALRSELRLTD